jgi:hypothetical protein
MFDARPDALHEEVVRPTVEGGGGRLRRFVIVPGAALVLALSFLFFHWN